MLTFSQEQNQPQQEASPDITRSNTATPAASHQAHIILHLQRTLGNRAVQRLLRQAGPDELEARFSTTRSANDISQISMHAKAPITIQPKLAVNIAGDIYEQEADHLAEQAMRIPEPQLQRACACGGGCPRCQTKQLDREPEHLQTKHVGSSDSGQTAAPPIVHEVLSSPGQPLDTATRCLMEPRFLHDFSRVRVHAHAKAAESAEAVNARAYTVGQDVVFGEGQYAPGTAEGKKLLSHELAHVVQQGKDGASPTTIRRQSDPRKEVERQLREKEARHAELQRRIQALSDQLTSLQQRRLDVASQKQRRADLRAARAEGRAANDPTLTAVLDMMRRGVIRVEQTATTIRFVATMEITFLGLSEKDGSSRAGTEIPRIVQTIRDAWTVAFTEGVYKGVAFSIDPHITYRPANTPGNASAWQIEVRARDDKQGTIANPMTGLISMNPVHLQGDRVRIIGHELFHLFGRILDLYMPPPEDVGGKAVPKPNVSVGRPDPKGRPDLLGIIDPVVAKRWLDKGYITKADFDRQTGTMPKVWQEDLEQLLQGLGVMTPRELQMEQIAQQTNLNVQRVIAAQTERNSTEWLKLVEESIQLEKEIASLRSRLGQQAPKQPQP
jgi:hypothetical protein